MPNEVETNGNGEIYANGKSKNRNGIPKNSSQIFQSSSPNESVTEFYSFEVIVEIKNYLLSRTKIRPKIGIICGTGLGHLAENLTDSISFPYEEIPNFPVSTVVGHAGQMVFGYLNGIEVMCMQGRFHYYEGYPLSTCAMPVRVMKFCGCTHLIATNAAGGINSEWNVGDLMIIKDHINIMGFAGNSPLLGPNDQRFGPRFPPMNNAYDPELIKIAKKLAIEMGIENKTREGVYTCVGGPNYETVAEHKMWKMLGVNAMGMSTVHEIIMARHCNLKVFAFSLITNKCETEYEECNEVDHEDVVSIGQKVQVQITKFVTSMVEKINELIVKEEISE